jgi:hypothetical protein
MSSLFPLVLWLQVSGALKWEANTPLATSVPPEVPSQTLNGSVVMCTIAV